MEAAVLFLVNNVGWNERRSIIRLFTKNSNKGGNFLNANYWVLK